MKHSLIASNRLVRNGVYPTKLSRGAREATERDQAIVVGFDLHGT
jgi:hypothetical protein